MGTKDAKSNPAIGFLTVIKHDQHGLFGGYLVLNTAGQPLEFHCTAPIKPNRAQEILYGPTLESFLYGEQIGRTLIDHGEHPPLVVCTDQKPVLATRDHVSMPLVLVLPSAPEKATAPLGDDPASGESGPFLRLDAAHHDGPRLATFEFGRNRLALPERANDDRHLIAERLAGITESFDLEEPFHRIRSAIAEAQQAAR